MLLTKVTEDPDTSDFSFCWEYVVLTIWRLKSNMMFTEVGRLILIPCGGSDPIGEAA